MVVHAMSTTTTASTTSRKGKSTTRRYVSASTTLSPASSNFSDSSQPEPMLCQLSVFENQRWLPIKGWNAKQRMGSDPAPWTDCYGSGPVTKEDLLVPVEGGRWIGGWEPNPNWEYAPTFCSKSWHWKEGTTDCVRRRRWTREYTGPEGMAFVPPPEPDRDIRHCMLCKKSFGGCCDSKQHCRKCLYKICAECSSGSLSVPGYTTEQRACNDCLVKAGKPVKDWCVVERFTATLKRARAKRMAGLKGSKETARLIKKMRDGSPPVGHLHIALVEGRGLQAGWAGDVGTPNPVVSFFLSNNFVQCPGKVQTHDPVWGGEEGSVVIPCSDHSSSLFFSVSDVAPSGLIDPVPIGRGAVPVPYLIEEHSSNPNQPVDSWFELLPPGPAEQAGYDKVHPKLLRGCSTVAESLGMKDPGRSLGFIRLRLEWTWGPEATSPQPLVKEADINYAYFTSVPQEGAREEDGDENVIDRLQDNAARLAEEVAPPGILLAIWAKPMFTGISLCVWGVMCLFAQVHEVPLFCAALLIINGLLNRHEEERMQNLILFEENNPFKEPALWKKLSKITGVVKRVRQLHNPLGRAATVTSRLSSLFSYKETAISSLATTILLITSSALSVLLYFLSMVPLRLYIFALGTALLVVPSSAFGDYRKRMEVRRKLQSGKVSLGRASVTSIASSSSAHGSRLHAVPSVASTDSVSSDYSLGYTDATSQPMENIPKKTECQVQREHFVEKVLTYAHNFFHRIPDDRELSHRAICKLQMRDTPLHRKHL